MGPTPSLPARPCSLQGAGRHRPSLSTGTTCRQHGGAPARIHPKWQRPAPFAVAPRYRDAMTTTPRRPIELWLVDLDAAGPVLAALERDAPRLTAADRARARRWRDSRERRRRLAAYAALRIVLERVAGPGVRGRRIVRPPGDRPRLAAAGPHFSLSHAGGWALIGVARGDVIGVDLETARSL